MIKQTKISSQKQGAQTLFIISGGPGLSSLTVRNLDLLQRNFNLVYIDFPGTNGNPYLKDSSYEELSFELQKIIAATSGEKYVLGHSYGGFFAADSLLNNVCDGIICLSTPFSKISQNAAGENYTNHETPALKNARSKWNQLQDDYSFAEWLSEYGPLYFVNPEGLNLILNDKVSAAFFKANRDDIENRDSLLEELKTKKAKKIFIAGAEDKMLPPDVLKKDAESGGFEFYSVLGASHFTTFDQPEKIARLIEEKLLRF